MASLRSRCHDPNTMNMVPPPASLGVLIIGIPLGACARGGGVPGEPKKNRGYYLSFCYEPFSQSFSAFDATQWDRKGATGEPNRWSLKGGARFRQTWGRGQRLWGGEAGMLLSGRKRGGVRAPPPPLGGGLRPPPLLIRLNMGGNISDNKKRICGAGSRYYPDPISLLCQRDIKNNSL